MLLVSMWHLAEWARRLLSFLIRFDEQHLPLKVTLFMKISLVHLYVKLLHLTRYWTEHNWKQQ